MRGGWGAPRCSVASRGACWAWSSRCTSSSQPPARPTHTRAPRPRPRTRTRTRNRASPFLRLSTTEGETWPNGGFPPHFAPCSATPGGCPGTPASAGDGCVCKARCCGLVRDRLPLLMLFSPLEDLNLAIVARTPPAPPAPSVHTRTRTRTHTDRPPAHMRGRPLGPVERTDASACPPASPRAAARRPPPCRFLLIDTNYMCRRCLVCCPPRVCCPVLVSAARLAALSSCRTQFAGQAYAIETALVFWLVLLALLGWALLNARRRTPGCRPPLGRDARRDSRAGAEGGGGRGLVS